MAIQEYIQKKLWKHVEDRLKNIEQTSAYYAGGTLSLPLGKNSSGDDIGICLNICGKGFVLSSIKNQRVYQPEYITRLVKKIYLAHKGKTDYYRETIREKRI